MGFYQPGTKFALSQPLGSGEGRGAACAQAETVLKHEEADTV